MQSLVKPDSSIQTIPGEPDQSLPQSTRPYSVWRNLAEIVVMVLILVGLLNFLTVNAELVGSSMSGTLEAGQRVLASRITYTLLSPERGDIVVMRDPLNPSGVLVRRVIGLPGERLELRGLQVLINGQPLNEDYIGNPIALGTNLTTTIQMILPENQYYVLGDNRLSLNDSRTWGSIPSDDILGRAWLVYWPPDSIAAVKHARYDQAQER